ncbi:MAG: rod shape-determining protein MreD [Bacteroidota bacterium]
MILETLLYLLRFIVILFIQILLINNIELSSYVNPYIYISFILLLPVTVKPWQIVLISFFCGAVMDAFSSTPGLHIAATNFMGFIRIHYLKATTTKEDIEGRIAPTLSQKGIVWFVFYCFVMTLIHHTILFFLEIYGFQEFFSTITRIFFSSIVTVLLIVIGQLLFYHSKTRNG